MMGDIIIWERDDHITYSSKLTQAINEYSSHIHADDNKYEKYHNDEIRPIIMIRGLLL